MKKLLFTIIISILSNNCYSQDDNFTQTSEVPMMRNPALTGIFDCAFRLTTIYRNQWNNVTVPFQTGSLGLEWNFAPDALGNYFSLGTQILYDVAGDSRYQNIQALPVLAYHLSIGKIDISAGFMAGYVNSNFSTAKLTWDQQFIGGQYSAANPPPAIDHTNKSYFDISAGLIGLHESDDKSRSYYLGAAIYHVNSPKILFEDMSNINSRLGWRTCVNVGMTKKRDDYSSYTIYGDLYVQPTIKQIHRQCIFGGFYSVELPGKYELADKVRVHAGAMCRWDDALAPMIKLDYGMFSLGASYDLNIFPSSKLSRASKGQGGFEFSIGIRSCFGSGASVCPWDPN